MMTLISEMANTLTKKNKQQTASSQGKLIRLAGLVVVGTMIKNCLNHDSQDFMMTLIKNCLNHDSQDYMISMIKKQSEPGLKGLPDDLDFGED